jgi:exodeoxyribonuclease VII large subunit
LHLQSYFIPAIGHKEDVTLLQQIADKAFITPTALGQYFNDIYDSTVAELQNSKAGLISSITKDVESRYESQLHHLKIRVRYSWMIACILVILAFLLAKSC